jgi:hypothetical protein
VGAAIWWVGWRRSSIKRRMGRGEWKVAYRPPASQRPSFFDALVIFDAASSRDLGFRGKPRQRWQMRQGLPRKDLARRPCPPHATYK